MKCPVFTVSLVTVCVMGAAWITTTLAGPILFDPDVPDELRCLAAIESVSVGIDPEASIPPHVDRQELLELATSILRQHDFEVVLERGTPHLMIHFLKVQDDKVPEAVALTTTLAVHQRVRLHRLAIDLVLPSGTVATSGIARQADLRELYRRQTRTVVDDFVFFAESANAVAKFGEDAEMTVTPQ